MITHCVKVKLADFIGLILTIISSDQFIRHSEEEQEENKRLLFFTLEMVITMLQVVTVLVKISAKVASWQPTDLKKKIIDVSFFPLSLFCKYQTRISLK